MGSTPYRPDIALWRNFSDMKDIVFVELTVPLEENMDNAHEWKNRKYKVGDSSSKIPLLTVVEGMGWIQHLNCVEVSSLGLIKASHFAPVVEFFFRADHRVARKLYRELQEIALRCSHVLWEARGRPLWGPRPVLQLSAEAEPVMWTPGAGGPDRGGRTYRDLLGEW
jgi:hypothetical protein